MHRIISLEVTPMCVKLTLSTNDQMIQSNVVTPYMKALEKIFMKFPIGSGHLVFRHFSNGRLSKKSCY